MSELTQGRRCRLLWSMSLCLLEHMVSRAMGHATHFGSSLSLFCLVCVPSCPLFVRGYIWHEGQALLFVAHAKKIFIALRILHESKRKFKWSCRKIVKPAMCCKRAGWRFASLITKDQLLYAVDCFLACLQRAGVDKVCWEVR